jgi:LPXTG-motif cell wall-anchored protein
MAKRTQAKKLKQSRNRKRVSNLLMTSLIIGGTVVPVAISLADELQPTQEASTPPQTEVATTETTQATPTSEEPTTDTKQVPQETQPSTTVTPETSAVTESQPQETQQAPTQTTESQTQQEPVADLQEKMNAAGQTPRVTGDWHLKDDGFWYLGDDYQKCVKVVVTLVDADTGAVLGTHRDDTPMGVYYGFSTTIEDIVDTQKYGIESTNPYVDYGTSIYTDGNPNGYYSGYYLRESVLVSSNDGQGTARVTVPVKNYANVTPDPDPEEVSFTVRHVDQDGKDIETPRTYTGLEGTQEVVTANGYSDYTLDAGQEERLEVTYAKGMSDIVFHYTKVEDDNSEYETTTTLHFIDTDTGKEIADPMTVTGEKQYGAWTELPEIQGYELVKEEGVYYKDNSVWVTFGTEPSTMTLRYKSTGETPTPDPDPTPEEDSQYRGQLEDTIKDAKPYVNKDKYVSSYVDKLDTAIKTAEQVLKDNPAPKSKKAKASSLDTIFLAQITAVTKAVDEVKAHPVKEDPQATGKVKVVFVAEGTDINLAEPLEISGKVGESYTIDSSKFIKEAPFQGVLLKLNQEWFDTQVKPHLTGTFTEGTKTIKVIYSQAIIDDDDNDNNNTDNDNNNDNGNTDNSDTDNSNNGNTDNSDTDNSSDNNNNSNNNGNNTDNSTDNSSNNNGTNNSGSNNTNNNGNNTSNTGSNNTNKGDLTDSGRVDKNGNTVYKDKDGNLVTKDGTKVDKADTLPKTGETSSTWVTALGLTTVLGVLGAFFMKRKRAK